MKKKFATVKNHVRSNRGKYAAGVTAVAMISMHRAAVKEWNAFLDEHNLLEEYYTPAE